MTRPLGWKARVGLILPVDNAVAEPEFYRFGVEGLTFHAARLSTEVPEEMRAEAVSAAAGLRLLGVDVVVYACAETSFDAGSSSRSDLIDVIANTAGTPVVTATSAMLAAAEFLALKRVVIVSPYSDASGTLLVRTFEEQGVEVVAATHHDFQWESDDPRRWYLTNLQAPERVRRLVAGADHPQADGIVVSATNLAFSSAIESTETDVGKPVIGCNQAILWELMRTLSLTETLAGFGSLLRGGSG